MPVQSGTIFLSPSLSSYTYPVPQFREIKLWKLLINFEWFALPPQLCFFSTFPSPATFNLLPLPIFFLEPDGKTFFASFSPFKILCSLLHPRWFLLMLSSNIYFWGIRLILFNVWFVGNELSRVESQWFLASTKDGIPLKKKKNKVSGTFLR